MAESVYEALGDGRYRSTPFATGPWDPGAQHGGAPGALVAGELQRAVAAADLGVEFHPARITIELQRPVPVDEIRVETNIRRPGRRICLADASVSTTDGTVVLTATMQGIRRRPFDGAPLPDDPVPPGPEEGLPMADPADEPPTFHRRAVEHRFVRGTSFDIPGPATDWIRLAVPLVAGQETQPIERVLAAADFGNGVSRLFEGFDVLFVNPDLTVTLFRLPEGEWVCLDAVTRFGPDGVGLAESLLFDEQGCIGRATQTLLVEPR